MSKLTDIASMARKAGFDVKSDIYGEFITVDDIYINQKLERLVALVAEHERADEREACAQVCDAEATIEGIAQRCAANIRVRGSK